MRTKGTKAVSVNKYLGWALFIPTALLLYLIILRPIGVGAIYSLFKLKGFTPVEFVGFKNYVTVLTNSNFLNTLLNSIKYCGWSLLIGFPLPIITAVMLNEVVHCKHFFKTSVYLPVIVPGIAVYMIWKQLYQPGPSGILNMLLEKFGLESSQWLQNPDLTIPLLIIVETWKGFGSTSLMYLAVLQGINQDLYEAANIDGANIWHKFRYIMMPELYTMMLLFGVKQMVGVFQIFESVMTMTGGGPNNASNTLGLMTYNYGFVNFQFDKALAMGFVTFCILTVLSILYFKLENKMSEGE